MIQVKPPVIDGSRFSSWTRMKRVVAWMLRFTDRCRRKLGTPSTWESTGSEIQRAKEHITRQSKPEAFPEKWKTLHRKTGVSSMSKILSLSPILKDGLIRLNSRVGNKEGSTFQSVISDKKNHIVRLFILHYHCKAEHHGRKKVVNDLRQRFWVTKIQMAVRRS